MIHYDVTKMGGAAPRSGLTRLSSRLQRELGDRVAHVAWDGRRRRWREAGGRGEVAFRPEDWLVTVELFSEAERPGIRDFLARPPCRTAAMFYDAIPIRHPHITWPQSVRRHPEHMKLLAGCDLVFAISEASRADLEAFWRWQGTAVRARVVTLALGADFDGSARVTRAAPPPPRKSLLCVGIVEPRKNQCFLLEVCGELWGEGLDFDLHVVGRVNPHFGRPIERRMRACARREPRFRWHAAAPDAVLSGLYAGARAVVFPTIAEGYGLPVLEALWRGVPCACSDLPVLREIAEGGCLLAPVGDRAAWKEQLARLLGDDAGHARLQAEAMARPLPRWRDTATALLAALA